MLDYHIDVSRGIVITRAIGRVTLADLTSHLTRLMRDPAFRPELNALIIAADVDAVPSQIGVGAITPLVRAWSKRRAGVKWAFVLPNQSTREFAESALDEARLTSLTARCFLSESSALTWLEPVADSTTAVSTKTEPTI